MTTNAGHKLCVDTLSPKLSDDLHIEKIKCCGTLASNRKAMPMIVGRKIKLKCSDKGPRVGIT
jgi:hypothetical protein